MSSNDQSGVIVHVRGHSRGGPHGAVDVSAYDRSPPGGGAADSGDRAWERQTNAEFRDAIAKAERSAEHYNHGYRQVYDNQIHAFGLDGYVGQTIKDTAGSPSACLGIVAAGHRAGARAVKRRFTTHDGRQKGHRRPGYKNRSLHCKALA